MRWRTGRGRSRLLLAVFLVCGVALCGAAPAWAAGTTVYVAGAGAAHAGSAADTGNCQSESSPCATIAFALTQGGSGATVAVAGTVGERNITIASDATIEQDSLDVAHPATVDEPTSQTGSLFVIQGAATVTLSGINLDGLGVNGAVIDDLSTGMVTASDDTFAGGATGDGGAIYDDGGGAVTVTGDTFNHSSAQVGAAIWAGGGGALNVTDSTFTSTSTGGGDGGAIYINSATAVVDVADSTFSADAGANGGAIADEDSSSLNVLYTTFFQDEAFVSAGLGGAIYVAPGNSGGDNIIGSTFDANTANGVGALATVDPGADGNTLDVSASVSAPTLAGNVFYGTCHIAGSAPVDKGYNVGYDGSCLPSSPASTDAVSASVADLTGLTTETGAIAGSPQTDPVGAANPGAGVIPIGSSVLVGGTPLPLCPANDEAGVASSGACDAGASQVTVPRPALYVAHAGSNAGGCTAAGSPCATVTYALAQQNQYSDPTVYASGDVSEDSIDIAQDVTITQSPGAPAAAIDGTGLSATQPLFDITGGTVAITGITIENAFADGAVLVDDPGKTVTFSGDDLSDNEYSDGVASGGAISNTSAGTVNVSATTFSGNIATTGGAISSTAGAIDVSDSHFTGPVSGSTVNGAGLYGGAISITGGTLTVTGSDFTDEVVGNDGGAIDIADGAHSATATVTDSVFDANSAVLGGVIASGLNGGTATLTVSGSTFADNGEDVDSAGAAFGGAILNGYGSGSQATASISDSTFYGGQTIFNGGAIDNAERGATATLTVTGATFFDNNALLSGNPDGGEGGAIDNADAAPGPTGSGTLDVFSSTFVNDTVNDDAIPSSQLINNGVGGNTTVAGDIFEGDCVGGGTGAWTDDGYNAGSGTNCTNPGVTTDVSVGSGAALDLGPAVGELQTFEPIFGSPAVNLIPNGTIVAGTQICPFSDIYGHSEFAYLGACNAGAIQTYTSLAPTGSATSVSVVPGNGQATVTWVPPSLADAGGEITEFTVTPHNVTTGQDGAPLNTAVDSLVVTGLINGDSYTFTVVTTNSIGSGPASAPSAAVTVQVPITSSTPPPPPVSTTPAGSTPATGTTPVTTKPPTSHTTTATIDNKKLTLVTPPTYPCVATSKRATVKLTVTTIPKSKKAKLTFVSAVFMLGAKQAHTSHQASSSDTFTLKGLKKATYLVRAEVTFREKLAHGKTKIVTKTVSGSLPVC
jgi:fibronectin-binding autotransporter adhesin